MSKRISKKKANEMRENEIKSQELNKKGIKPKMSRQERKRRIRMSKSERFFDMLRRRGGHFEENSSKDIKNKDNDV